jgi:spore maturation protein CgeB
MLPWGLTEVDIPTGCFQIDTFAYTRRRISWSMVFDLVFVFHPGYDAEFRKAGHPQAHLIPHAIDASIFSDDDFERVYEVGWVGQTEGPLYQTRARLLPEFSRTFRMNEWSRRYSQEETARTYLQSRVVVNIGRDDFPQDANLRVFEAMAAGALLITILPSELTQLGFEEGVHFIGYHEAREIVPIVRKYLGEESTRRRVADVARNKVMGEYTYDRRVDTILDTTEKYGRKFAAPARAWSEEKVRLAYLDYFAGNGAFDCASTELLAIARRSLGNAARGTALLARAWARKLRL